MARESSGGGGSIPKHHEKEIDLRENLLVIIKRRWIVAIIVAVVVTVTLTYNLRQTPVFRSTAVLNIDRTTYNFLPRVTNNDYAYEYDGFFQTQYKLLQSFTLAQRVQKKLNITPYDLAPPKERLFMKKTPTISNDTRDQVAD